jgi:hypothetical protein
MLLKVGIAAFGMAAILGVAVQEEPKASYEQLLERVKKADPKADFRGLRMAFMQTPWYKPYDQADKTAQAMNAALEKKDYKKALELANTILQTKYVDWNAHIVAYRAHAELKNSDQSKFHRFVCDGLIRSIMQSGNGKTPATAFVVISIDEEDAVLGALGIRQTRQTLQAEGNRKVDRIDGVDERTNNAVTLYFDVTAPLSSLEPQRLKQN